MFATGAVLAGVIVILTIAVLLSSVPSFAWYVNESETLKSEFGVYSTCDPETAPSPPFEGWSVIENVRLSLSTSEALKEINNAVFSTRLTDMFSATGASFTAFTVIVAVPTLTIILLSKAILSSVASKVKVSTPFQLASGVYNTLFPFNAIVPLFGSLKIPKV